MTKLTRKPRTAGPISIGPTRADSLRKFREYADRMEGGRENPYLTVPVPEPVLERQVNALRKDRDRIIAENQKTRRDRVRGGQKRGEAVMAARLDTEKRVAAAAEMFRKGSHSDRGIPKKVAKDLKMPVDHVRRVLRRIRAAQK